MQEKSKGPSVNTCRSKQRLRDFKSKDCLKPRDYLKNRKESRRKRGLQKRRERESLSIKSVKKKDKSKLRGNRSKGDRN